MSKRKIPKIEDIIKNKKKNIFKLSDICISELYHLLLNNEVYFNSIHILSDNCVCIELANRPKDLINKIKNTFYEYKIKLDNSCKSFTILFISETNDEIEKYQYLINEIIKNKMES